MFNYIYFIEYIRGPTKGTFLDGYIYCRGQGSNLATITSKDDNKDAVNACGKNNCWIGFNDLSNEGKWEWLDETKSKYTNWNKLQPNNIRTQHCAHIIAFKSTWNDHDCLDKLFFPLCNPISSPISAENVKSELIKTIEHKVANDINSEPISNGIYFDNINVTSLVIFIIGVTLSIIFIVLCIKLFIGSIKPNKQKLYKSIRQSETEESATDSI